MKTAANGRKAAAVWVCLAVATLLHASVWAEETPAAEVIAITMDKAIEVAYDSNLALRMARLELDHAEKQLVKAQADAALAPSPVGLRQAEVAVETQKLLLEQTRRQVDLQVRSAYYAAISKTQQRAIAEKNLDQVQEQLMIITAKQDEGLATKLDVVNSEKGLLQAQGSLDSALAEEELAVLELKRVMGLPYTDKISVEPSDTLIESVELLPEQVVEKVLTNSLDLMRLQWALEISQMQEESARNEYTAPLIKDIYANRRMKAELDLKEATRNTYLQAKQAWNSLRQAEFHVELSEKELEAAEENYRITKVRFDGGLEIPNNLLRAQISLTSAQHGLVNAIFEYNLARIRLLNLIGE
ncbi:MAG: TolC family protein [Firmicutes bacterium]|nr:TolC family protein [Bacillota bacterium]